MQCCRIISPPLPVRGMEEMSPIETPVAGLFYFFLLSALGAILHKPNIHLRIKYLVLLWLLGFDFFVLIWLVVFCFNFETMTSLEQSESPNLKIHLMVEVWAFCLLHKLNLRCLILWIRMLLGFVHQPLLLAQPQCAFQHLLILDVGFRQKNGSFRDVYWA